VDEVSEVAAEAGAGNFAGIEALRRDEARVNQGAGLVVGDDGGAHAAAVEQARGTELQGGLAGAQETAGEHDGGAIRQAALTPHRHGLLPRR